MNEKIDLTKILKDCPAGTKLYSTIFGDVKFSHIFNDSDYPIVLHIYNGGVTFATKHGKHNIDYEKEGECVLFPSKEQRDWSKFTAPWYKKDKLVKTKFKVGDWVVRGDTVAQILDIQEQYYVGLDINGKYFVSSRFLDDDKIHFWTIQDVKDGDVLVNGSNIFIFHFINNRRLMGYCHVNMDDGNLYNDIGRNECFCTIDAPITPATKEQHDALMKAMNEAGYEWDVEKKELKKKEKFDPKTLQPFDKVLVRYGSKTTNYWYAGIFSNYVENDMFPYKCVGNNCKLCIPYNDDTKHLVGTSEEAPEYYKYWED